MRVELLPDIGNSGGTPNVYKNPCVARPGEIIGGGFFVMRRGRGTQRIRPSRWPFEHSSFASAALEAQNLARKNPGKQFDVVAVVSSFRETANSPAVDENRVIETAVASLEVSA